MVRSRLGVATVVLAVVAGVFPAVASAAPTGVAGPAGEGVSPFGASPAAAAQAAEKVTTPPAPAPAPVDPPGLRSSGNGVAKGSRLTLDLRTSTPRAGKAIRFSGSLTPRRSGATVLVQARKPGLPRWDKVTTARTTGAGRYRLSTKLTPGGWELRSTTRVSGRSVVSEPARVDVRGRSVKIVPRQNTVTLSPRDVQSVGAPSDDEQVVTYGPNGKLPTAGRVLTMNSSTTAPDGLIGRVKSVDPATRTVTLAPAALDEAYSTYKVATVATVDTLTAQSHAAGFRALSGSPFQAKCGGELGNPITKVDVDLSDTKVSFDFALSQRYMSLLVVSKPQITTGFGVAGSGSAGCSLELSAPSIPLGPTGLTLDISSTLELSINAQAAFDYTQATQGSVVVGFTVLRNQANYNRTSKFTNTPTLAISKGVAVELGLKNEVAIMIGGRAGVYGNFGPVLFADLALRDSQACVNIGLALDYGLGIKADLWIATWRIQLVGGRFTLASLPERCLANGTPPSGGGGGSGGGDPAPEPAPSPGGGGDGLGVVLSSLTVSTQAASPGETIQVSGQCAPSTGNRWAAQIDGYGLDADPGWDVTVQTEAVGAGGAWGPVGLTIPASAQPGMTLSLFAVCFTNSSDDAVQGQPEDHPIVIV